MYRAQGILKRWRELKQYDNDHSGVIPLKDFINYQYNQYLKLCDRCNEQSLPKGKWLAEKILVDFSIKVCFFFNNR